MKHLIEFYKLNENIKKSGVPIKYATIVYLQGDEAEEPLKILDEDGSDAAIEYLSQWDDGSYDNQRDKLSAGTSDHKITKGDYILSYNNSIGYISLDKMIKVED